MIKNIPFIPFNNIKFSFDIFEKGVRIGKLEFLLFNLVELEFCSFVKLKLLLLLLKVKPLLLLSTLSVKLYLLPNITTPLVIHYFIFKY
jgi:hypothetical protein